MTTKKEMNYVENYEANVKYFIAVCEERIAQIDGYLYKYRSLEDEKQIHKATINRLKRTLKKFRRIFTTKKKVEFLFENEPTGMFYERIGA